MAARYATVREAAEVLGMTPHALRYHLREGHLRGVRLGTSWRVDMEGLERGSDGLGAGDHAVHRRHDALRDASVKDSAPVR